MMLGLLQAKEEVERAIMLRSIAARALWLTKGAALFGGAVVTLALVLGVVTMAAAALLVTLRTFSKSLTISHYAEAAVRVLRPPLMVRRRGHPRPGRGRPPALDLANRHRDREQLAPRVVRPARERLHVPPGVPGVHCQELPQASSRPGRGGIIAVETDSW